MQPLWGPRHSAPRRPASACSPLCSAPGTDTPPGTPPSPCTSRGPGAGALCSAQTQRQPLLDHCQQNHGKNGLLELIIIIMMMMSQLVYLLLFGYELNYYYKPGKTSGYTLSKTLSKIVFTVLVKMFSAVCVLKPTFIFCLLHELCGSLCILFNFLLILFWAILLIYSLLIHVFSIYVSIFFLIKCVAILRVQGGMLYIYCYHVCGASRHCPLTNIS